MSLGLLTDSYILAANPPANDGDVNEAGDTFTRTSESLFPAFCHIDIPAQSGIKDVWYFETIFDFVHSSFKVYLDVTPKPSVLEDTLVEIEVASSSGSGSNFNINQGTFVDVTINGDVTEDVFINNETIVALNFDYSTGLGYFSIGYSKIPFMIEEDIGSLFVRFQLNGLEPTDSPTGILPVMFFNNGSEGFKLRGATQPWSDELYSISVETVKQLIGDVDSNNPYLPYEEYLKSLEEYNGNVLLTALNTARIARGRFATAIDEEVGRERVKFSQMFDQINGLIKDLEEQVGKRGLGANSIYAGGISNSDMIANDHNRDNRRPDVGMGTQKNSYPNNKPRRLADVRNEYSELR